MPDPAGAAIKARRKPGSASGGTAAAPAMQAKAAPGGKAHPGRRK